MIKPFKFRYVNEITGAFVLLVVFLLVAGVLVAGRAQRWFEPVARLTLRFPEQGSFGLRAGSEVQILGTTVGAVDKIVVKDDGHMTGAISIRGDFTRFLRQDSQAIVKKTFGVAGDAFVDITQGAGAPLPETGGVLDCTRDADLLELVEELVGQLGDELLPTVAQVRRATEEYTKVAESLLDAEGNVQKSLADVRAILNDVRTTTSRLPAMADTVSVEVDDLDGIVLQSQETIREITRLVEAVEQHWLIRGYVDQTKPTERIPPAKVGMAKGEQP